MATNLFENSDFRSTYIDTSHNTTLFTNRIPTEWGTYNNGVPNPLTSYHAYIDIDTFDFPVCVFNESNGSRNWKALYMGAGSFPGRALKDQLPNGPTTFWLSFDAYVTGSGAKLFGGFYYKQEAGGNSDFHSGQFNVNAPDLEGCIGQWKRISVEVPFNWDMYSSTSFYIYGHGFSANVILYIKNVKLEISESPTEWTPHREDNLTPEWLAAHSYTPPIIARDDLSLSRVNDGTNGVSVTGITAKYLVTSASSGVTTSTPGWTATPGATTTTNKYLWTYETITYSSGTSTNLTPHIISTHGATGSTGTGISSITTEFYKSTSKTTQSGGSWSTSYPTWTSGTYLWKRTKIVYSNPTSTVYTTAEVDTTWEIIDELQIGGRNLILNSNVAAENSNYMTKEYTTTENLVEGRKYSATVWGSLAESKGYFGLWFNGASRKQCDLKDNGDGTYSCTWTSLGPIQEGYTRTVRIYAYPSSVTDTSRIDKIKLEYGEKCTDWTPAPEDKANQSVLDAWASNAIQSGVTEINGGYIKTQTISTNQLDVADILRADGAIMGTIMARELNADKITSGTILGTRIDARNLTVSDGTRTTFSVSPDGEVLLRGDAESYGYVQGTTGWSIHSDGTAEFNNVTVRGDLIASSGGISKEEALGDIQKVRIWAGSSYEERESAPFIVYSDGSVKSVKGDFSGLWTGNIEVGNIKIQDPSAIAGEDALLEIKNGSTGVKRVKLTDMDASEFKQSIKVFDTFTNATLMSELGMDGNIYASNSIKVSSSAQLSPSDLEIGGAVLSGTDGQFICRNPLIVGQEGRASSMTVYGDAEVTNNVTLRHTIDFDGKVTLTIVDGGFNLDYAD